MIHVSSKEVIKTPIQTKMNLLETEGWKLPKAALDQHQGIILPAHPAEQLPS